jgi:hypothetical protein
MNNQENEGTKQSSEEREVKIEKENENGKNVQPVKEEKPGRNNSKRTGMPFGFDELFFKCDHHFVG